ncbi:ribbon-helix-helix protein, CopG family [Methylobacterium terricola]|uniref:Ribbon-helix-helix protein, CopG family n=1 Tax=Methylobacterium terricola TaxID=2583531 RepID=A0A5C4LB98_9HYPH|nr:ribbon-helix-helix domain-containing protein [Methylobacterium terricola]TNC08448.1 ribbon-helix-helix protein, CopG family [Methylobacterium terricola]
MLRLDPDMLAALDELIARQPDPKPSRPEAVRQVLAQALGLTSVS